MDSWEEMFVSDESSQSSETQPLNMSQQVKLCDFQLEKTSTPLKYHISPCGVIRNMPLRIQGIATKIIHRLIFAINLKTHLLGEETRPLITEKVLWYKRGGCVVDWIRFVFKYSVYTFVPWSRCFWMFLKIRKTMISIFVETGSSGNCVENHSWNTS